MCGIVGAVARRDVPGILLEGLQRLEYRGYDSAGIAVNAGAAADIERRRTVGRVQELADSLREAPIHGATVFDVPAGARLIASSRIQAALDEDGVV